MITEDATTPSPMPQLAMSRHTLCLLAAGTLLTGCAIPLRNGLDAPALARKSVVRKVAPDTLVALDGTRCTPTSRKFQATDVQKTVWCIWLVPTKPGSTSAWQRR